MNPREMEQVLEMKRKLDAISPSFCPVKWKHATISLGVGNAKSCCHQDFRQISLDSKRQGQQFHETPEDIKERQMMLKGERPKNCQTCWWAEDLNQLSDRHTWSSRTWMSDTVDDIIQSNSPKAGAPTWLEINFSSVCNLKCAYCSPIYSSQWHLEVKEHGPYPTTPKHNDLNYIGDLEFSGKFNTEDFVDNFWSWFKEIYPNLRLLKITGGEPLINKNTIKLLNYILENKNPKLDLSINTNLSIPTKPWQEFISIVKKFKHSQSVKRFYLQPSLDTWAKQAEYIRYGLDFDLFKRNLHDFLENTPHPIVFICTLNNLSLGGLMKFWEQILYFKQTYGQSRWISATTELLIFPEWLNLNILPENHQQKLMDVIEYVKANTTDNFNGFSRFEADHLMRGLESMKTKPPNLTRARNNFYTYFSEYDRRKNIHFLDYFPELEAFWELCKHSSLTADKISGTTGQPDASLPT